jgi:hypothetical protein
MLAIASLLSFAPAAMAPQTLAQEALPPEIQAQIDLPLRWRDPEGAKACRIGLRRDGDFTDRSKWPELFAWLLKYLEKLNAVFRPIVAEL